VESAFSELVALPLADEADAAAARVVRLVVPRVAEGCVVVFFGPEGHRPVAAAGVRSPASAEHVAESSTLRVPLEAGGLGAGYLTAWLENGRSFTADQAVVIEAAGRHLSAALERQRLRAQAEEALAQRDRFLAMASHELRTPLQALKLVLEVMATRAGATADELPADWLRAKLGRAQASAARIQLLVDTLLDTANLSKGGVVLHRERVDLADVARSVIEGLHDQLEWSGCVCRFTSRGLTDGNWDRLRLEIVVTNLISNAMKYGVGRPIDVEVAGAEEAVCLSVADRGIGIASSERARLFRPFERLATGANVGGFGLGLWTVKQLVDALGGAVAVESTPGAGSVFSVSLPR
jgi:signal transduction histidine kinase